jgi:hypothetical protein
MSFLTNNTFSILLKTHPELVKIYAKRAYKIQSSGHSSMLEKYYACKKAERSNHILDKINAAVTAYVSDNIKETFCYLDACVNAPATKKIQGYSKHQYFKIYVKLIKHENKNT